MMTTDNNIQQQLDHSTKQQHSVISNNNNNNKSLDETTITELKNDIIEPLQDIKVPDTMIIDRKILLRPDRCPCTLCRWFLYEVGQAVERIGITTLQSQAEMLRDSSPLLALAMSKDHRSAILWDIGFQLYQDNKFLGAARALCWSMSAGEGGVGGYFRLMDLKMFSDIYTNEKVKNTNYGKLLRAYARSKIASFYGMKKHPEVMVSMMREAFEEFECVLGQFDNKRDRSMVRYNMLKLSHGISNWDRNRVTSDLMSKAYKLWEEGAEEDWCYFSNHKWMAEDCRARARWADAESLYRVCSFLVEADNQYSADCFYSLAYATVRRLLGGGGKTVHGVFVESQKPITDFAKTVLEYLSNVMKVGMQAEKITVKLFGRYDAIVKLENLPFHPKKETLEFLGQHGITIEEPKPSPDEPEKGPDGKYKIEIDDINLKVPSTTFCSNCFSDGGAENKLKKCKGCEQARYCGGECQKAHWIHGNHKKYCKLLAETAKFPKISL